jgi:hypothetical protein
MSKIFKEKVDSFVERANTELANEKEELLEAKNKFKAVMRFYQYIPKGATLDTAEPYDFFNLWLAFCRDFKVLIYTSSQHPRCEDKCSRLAFCRISGRRSSNEYERNEWRKSVRSSKASPTS